MADVITDEATKALPGGDPYITEAGRGVTHAPGRPQRQCDIAPRSSERLTV